MSVVHLRAAVGLLGRFPALAGLDLDVDAGEVVLVEGANGAGKTSLLRACAGLLPIVSGEVVVLGNNLRSDRRSVRRLIGLFGHSSALYDDLTAEENVRFAALATRAAGVRVGPALARAGLSGNLASIPVGRLSAGQRRRVALASLWARDSSLWLLDEPHAGLDASARDALDGFVRGAQTAGATVLIAAHESLRARRLATRAVTMAGGRLVDPSPDNERDAIDSPRRRGGAGVPAARRGPHRDFSPGGVTQR